MGKRRVLRRVLAAGAAALVAVPSAHAEDDAPDRNVRIQLGERLTWEDNLYRLPGSLDPAALLGPAAHREDRIASTFLGLDGEWRHGEQEVLLDAQVTAQRFDSNRNLDNTSGKADLLWSWRLGSRWSGETGGRRERMLASFANTLALDRNLVDTATHHGVARFDMGPRWRATLSAREAATSHDSAARREDEVDLRAGAVGLDYRTPRGNRIGWEYARARAAFASSVAGSDGGSASDYAQRAASVTFTFSLSSKVAIDGSAGYLERDYRHAPASDFAGDVWRTALQWSPTGKSRVAVQRWRELKAYLDAESAHFVANGIGLLAAWSPLRTIDIAMQLSREDQHYIGAAADAIVEAARNDMPVTRTLSFRYAPRDRVSVDVAYRYEMRDSNRFRFDYGAESLSIGCEIKF